MISKISSRIFSLSRLIRYQCWAPGETYENRKASKRNLKTLQSFKVEHPDTLVDKIAVTSIMVPNFFTSQLAIKKFVNVPITSDSQNFFLNSYVSCTIPLATQVLLRQKLNKLHDKEVRIGRIFEIMDSIAAFVSYEHCLGDFTKRMEENKMFVVTGSVESLHLFQKLNICQDLTFQGYLNYVGKTSMQVQINILQQNRLKANSKFTMVARSVANPLKGYTVPALSFQHLSQNELSKALIRLQSAKQNVLWRKIQMENSYDRKAPTLEDIQSIHRLFLKRKGGAPLQTYPIAGTVITNSQIMHTQERNIHGKIFGGYLIREMIQIGWVAACKFAEDYMLMEDLTNIYFKQPVDVGSRLTLKAQITYVQNNRIVITVEAYTAKFTDKRQTLACYLHLVARGSKNDIRKVHPESYQQALQYLSSKKAFEQLFY